MTGDADLPRSSGVAALATTRPRASAVGAGSQDSSRLPPCPADDDASPRSPNRRTRWHSSPRCCGNLPSVNRQHRIAIDSSDSGHARRPPAPPLTPLRSMRLAASSKTRSETHARLVEQGQASPPPTKRGVKPRPGSSSWRPARRRTGRVRTPRRHRKPTTAPTFRCRPLGGAPRKRLLQVRHVLGDVLVCCVGPCAQGSPSVDLGSHPDAARRPVLHHRRVR